MTALSPTVELTVALMREPSVTPFDANCQTLMIERLQQIGFTVERLRFGDVDNFWARRGDNGPVLAFAGHTFPGYTALYTVVLNLIVAIVLTPIFNAMGGKQYDETVPADYR